MPAGQAKANCGAYSKAEKHVSAAASAGRDEEHVTHAPGQGLKAKHLQGKEQDQPGALAAPSAGRYRGGGVDQHLRPTHTLAGIAEQQVAPKAHLFHALIDLPLGQREVLRKQGQRQTGAARLVCREAWGILATASSWGPLLSSSLPGTSLAGRRSGPRH